MCTCNTCSQLSAIPDAPFRMQVFSFIDILGCIGEDQASGVETVPPNTWWKKNQVIIISSPSVVQNDSYHAHGIYHIYMIYRYIYIDQIDLDVFNSKWYGHMAFCRFWKVEKTVNKDFLLQYLAQFGGLLPTQLECEAWINCYFSHFGPEFSTYFFIDPPHGWPRQLFAKLRWLKASTLLLLQQDSCRPGGVFRVKIDYVCGFKFI